LGATHVVSRELGDKEVIETIRGVVGDELLYCFNTVSHDKTVAVGVLSNTQQGHLNSLTFGEVLDKALVGEKKMGYRDTLSHGASGTNETAAALFWDTLPTWLREGKIKTPSWTVIEGLDAEKVMEVLDKYRDGENIPSHVHVRP
jgi:NADPH:quinone reductase